MHPDDVSDVHDMRQATCLIGEELDRNESLRLGLRDIFRGLAHCVALFLLEECGSLDVECFIDEFDLAGGSGLDIWDRSVLDNSIDMVEVSGAKRSRPERRVDVLHLEVLIFLRFFFLVHFCLYFY